MMKGDQQHVLVLAQPDQAAADQRPCREIKTGGSFFPDQLVQLFLIVALLTEVVLEQLEATINGWGDALLRLARDSHKCGAQRLVTSDYSVQRLPQCCTVKLSLHSPTIEDVISLAGAELREEP